MFNSSLSNSNSVFILLLNLLDASKDFDEFNLFKFPLELKKLDFEFPLFNAFEL